MDYCRISPAQQQTKPIPRARHGQTGTGKLQSHILVEVCKNLKPFQSLEFDPQSGLVTIITELLVASSDEQQIIDILAHHGANEKVVVRRYADTFKIAFTRHIRV
ncbi:MAG: hypothetical protein DCC55_30580 [Chloroflexi bacterium]|nr:MAG: hypothetical protein DCC55_30580 [Chloroflexota bacterium]